MLAGRNVRYKFGCFELDVTSGELTRNGRVIRLQPQAAQVLSSLVTRPGELVTRDELRLAIWGEDTFVDFDHGLNKAVNKLREVLNDSAANPRFIETLPKRGYRFIAPVTPDTDAAEPVPQTGNGGTETDALRATEAVRCTDPNTVAAPRPVHRIRFWTKLVAALAVLLVIAGVLWARKPSKLRATGSRQLSHDGRHKGLGLMSDGRRVYFLEPGKNPRDFEIAYVSASGGDTTHIQTPFPLPWGTFLFDITRDGSQLLVGVTDGDGTGMRRLWMVPVSGGAARPIGALRIHDATLSPDGKRVVYDVPEGIFAADARDGTGVRKLVAAGYSDTARWWPDGSHIRFNVDDAVWDVNPDGSGRIRVPGAPHRFLGWALNGRFSLFDEAGQLWSLQNARGWFGPPVPTQLTFESVHGSDTAPDPERPVIYTIGDHRRGELVRFDRRRRVWEPYLSGISAQYVDFSPDGRWLAYVDYPEGGLWRCGIDGSARVQLAASYIEVHLPRWSPDGKQIVFSAIERGSGVRKMYLVPSAGGSVSELLAASESHGGTPNWSPDAKKIVFARFPFEVARTDIDVSILDLDTNLVTRLPGGVSGYSPRWSPDGKYIVVHALSPASDLMLYRVADGTWRHFSEGGSYPVWSRDSKHVFMAVDNVVKRIGLDGSEEKVADFVGLERVTTRLGAWCGVAPDESIIALRDAGNQEVLPSTSPKNDR